MMGTVYLVGAGPGDPGLLTVRGKELLEKADCLVYDRLIAPRLLELAPAGCERIDVGKTAGHHTMPQAEICRLLAQKAGQYQTVVRLKGGDPFVFGRGGEECLYLKEQGVPFEVVPGITSAVAGLAAAGIPITHRGIARGFRVYTAHDLADGFGGLDFAQLARTDDTLVLLMGLSRLEEISRRLLEAGKPGHTPAAVISRATLPTQRTARSTLDTIAAEADRLGLESPALIAIGPAVTLGQQLNWFENRPLFGRRVLLPCTGPDRRLARLLEEQGAAVQAVQVSRLEPLPDAWANLCKGAGASWAAFTSRNGVKFFFEAARAAGADARCLAGVQIAALGPATAKALEQYGLRADFISPAATGEGLAAALADEMMEDDRLLLVGPEGDPAPCWQSLGVPVIYAPVYRNTAEQTALPAGPFDFAVFTCASAVERCQALAAAEGTTLAARLSGAAAAAMGPVTARAMEQAGLAPIQAETPGYPPLVRLLCRLAAEN